MRTRLPSEYSEIHHPERAPFQIVRNGRASSPIIAGEYQRVGLKDDIYHVVPIKFFDVELDNSRKYTTRTQIKERDAEGNATLVVTKVVPRRK